MKNFERVLIIVLALILIFTFFHRPSGYKQREAQLKEQIKRAEDKADSLSDAYDKIILEKDSAALKAFSDAQTSANRMEGEANFWKAKYKDEKKHKTGIVSDRAYDSLLNSLYPGQP